MQWILSRDQRGMPPTTAIVRHMAGLLATYIRNTRNRAMWARPGYGTSLSATTRLNQSIIASMTTNERNAKIRSLFEAGFNTYSL